MIFSWNPSFVSLFLVKTNVNVLVDHFCVRVFNLLELNFIEVVENLAATHHFNGFLLELLLASSLAREKPFFKLVFADLAIAVVVNLSNHLI
jgi:hypothetical protein